MRKLRVFLSYTSREEEVRYIRPLIDQYCRDLWEWARTNGLDIFYDEYTMQKRQYSSDELREILGNAVHRSHLMTAFLSPEYVMSEWCRFEWLETRKERRPILHGVLWKMFRLDMPEMFLLAEYLSPEAESDVTYIRQNPTPEKTLKAARQCVQDSIQLIRRYYRV